MKKFYYFIKYIPGKSGLWVGDGLGLLVGEIDGEVVGL